MLRTILVSALSVDRVPAVSQVPTARDLRYKAELQRFLTRDTISLDELFGTVMRVGTGYVLRTPRLDYRQDPSFLTLYSALNSFMVTKRNLLKANRMNPDDDVEISMVAIPHQSGEFVSVPVKMLIREFLEHGLLYK